MATRFSVIRLRVHNGAVILYYLGLLLTVVGAIAQSKELMAGGTLAVALGYGVRDYSGVRPDSITPMTIYAFVFGTWIGLGHLVACFAIGTAYEETFYSYAAMDFLLEAQYLAVLTVVVPLVSYRWFEKLHRVPRRFAPRVQNVAIEVSDRTLLVVCLAMLVVDLAVKVYGFQLEFLGTLGGFLAKTSEISIFLLAWHWIGPSPTLPKWTRACSLFGWSLM